MTRKIDIEALCADKGLRITEQRRVIAKVLGDSEDHPDVETLQKDIQNAIDDFAGTAVNVFHAMHDEKE